MVKSDDLLSSYSNTWNARIHLFGAQRSEESMITAVGQSRISWRLGVQGVLRLRENPCPHSPLRRGIVPAT